RSCMRRWPSIPLGLALALVASAAIAHPLDYRIDTVHSQVLFSADHDGYSNPVGRLAIARGWLRFDPDDWSASKVVADIDLASADLGDKGWDKAVVGSNFLDAAKFPTAHFESVSVAKTGKNTGTLDGKLTLRGVTLPVKVEFTVNRVGATLFGFETIAGFWPRDARSHAIRQHRVCEGRRHQGFDPAGNRSHAGPQRGGRLPAGREQVDEERGACRCAALTKAGAPWCARSTGWSRR